MSWGEADDRRDVHRLPRRHARLHRRAGAAERRTIPADPATHSGVHSPRIHADRVSVLRFDLAMQKSHPLVYTAALISTARRRHALGVFDAHVSPRIAVWTDLRCVSAAMLFTLFSAGSRPALSSIRSGSAPTSSWSRSASTPPAASTARGSSGTRPSSAAAAFAGRQDARRTSSASPTRRLRRRADG